MNSQMFDPSLLKAASEALDRITVVGHDNSGDVVVTIDGHRKVRDIKIAESLLNPSEKEVLQRLIIAAFNDAHNKLIGEIAKIDPYKL